MRPAIPAASLETILNALQQPGNCWGAIDPELHEDALKGCSIGRGLSVASGFSS